MTALLRNILFKLAPENAHALALLSLQIAYRLGLKRFFPKLALNPKNVMGLHFPNPIGLAAGFDKNGDYVDALAMLGFGFIEIGTVTPQPQTGNAKPRLFRLLKEQALINRMGFNNKGMLHVVERLKKIKYQGILGINIGKNRDTPLEKAIDDYVLCFRTLAPFASYITINISSPNTPGLRDLQETNRLETLLDVLKQEQNHLAATQKKYVPLVLKISPDLRDDALKNLATVCVAKKIDGIIATNTTLERKVLADAPFANEAGGLSGQPLQARSTAVIKQLSAHFAQLNHVMPIIASGGMMDAQALKEKAAAGAGLFQIYSGFIYHGPDLIQQLINASRRS